MQVIPYGVGGHASPTGFSILRFAERDLPDIVYVENLTSALYLDKQADTDRYLLAMERLSIVATSGRRRRESSTRRSGSWRAPTTSSRDGGLPLHTGARRGRWPRQRQVELAVLGAHQHASHSWRV